MSLFFDKRCPSKVDCVPESVQLESLDKASDRLRGIQVHALRAVRLHHQETTLGLLGSSTCPYSASRIPSPYDIIVFVSNVVLGVVGSCARKSFIVTSCSLEAITT